MTSTRSTRHRRLRQASGLLLAATLSASLAACTAAAPTDGDAAAGGGFPVTLPNPYGETVIPAKPERVAVVDFVDLDIALALGVEPIISSQYGDTPLDPWQQERLDELGIEELETYDATDSTDFEAIAAADPDVILATSAWTLDEDYEKLQAIAPVVAYPDENGLAELTWIDRTRIVGTALGLEDEAEQVVDEVAAAFADARASHPEFEGRTLTYSVVHPDQITFVTYAGSDVTFFDELGFVQSAAAAGYGDADTSVAKENLDALDADVLLVGYPFGDEGLLSRADLEQDRLFQTLPVVKAGHYAVLDDLLASPIAYPTPLSHPWVLGEVLPLLEQATR